MVYVWPFHFYINFENYIHISIFVYDYNQGHYVAHPLLICLIVKK